ncbi:hypothetical protein Efla_002773 [Eimeria flavescens]
MDGLHGCLPLHFAGSASSRWRRFLRRCCRPSQLDIQYSVVQCKLLLSNPSRLYSLAALRQKQQHSCAREDPAFLLLLLLLLTLTGIGHAAALQAAGPATFAAVAAAPLLLFCLCLLLVFSTAVLCMSREAAADDSNERRGLPAEVAPLVLQPVLLLLPVLLRRWLAAALHCYGLWGYAYVSSLGYLAAGQLKSAAPLLLTVGGLMLTVCCCTAAGVDFLFAPSRFLLLAASDSAAAEHAISAAPSAVDLQVQ